MITINPDLKLFIYNRNVDMRKAIDGLASIIVDSMQLEPQSKIMFIFFNNSKDKIKAIVWEGDGFLLLYKRLEKGKFKFPRNIIDNHYEIDADLFNWLRKGFDFHALKQHPELKTSKYF